MSYNRIEEFNLEGKSVFLRLDLNVPLHKGKITDETRIVKSLPTIKYLLDKKAKLVIASHLGRPEGKELKKFSLTPVGERLAELINREVLLVCDYQHEPVDQLIKQLGKHQVILLENLRFFPGETENDQSFAEKLVKGIDYYVNDAFGASHRRHASITSAAEILAKDKRSIGFLMEKEIEALEIIRNSAKIPFVVVMGGAKVSDKISVILSLLTRCHSLLIGGAMAYTFLKFKGFQVGSSRVEEDKFELIESIYRTAASHKVDIILPVDHLAACEFHEHSQAIAIDSPNISKNLMGLDIGPKTRKIYKDKILQAKTVFWNGPMGVFEWPQFSKGTAFIAKALAESEAYTVVGGGESLAAVHKEGVEEQISHISTGGGASLEYLEGSRLPGLEVMSFI